MELRERWPLRTMTAERDTLLVAWGRPGYHDTRHLTEVLDRIDELDAAGVAFDRVPVLLAAWWHDAVHEGRDDDEELSARWAERDLPDPPAAEVARLVRMTRLHLPFPDDNNGCVLSDADLAILAAPAERYAAYVADVRREYAHVADADFRAGRAAVLRDLLDKPTLFHTAPAIASWEARARDNVGAELAELG